MTRKTIVSTVTALALSAVIAGPALAGSPTYSGTIWCTVDGADTDMGPQYPGAIGWTKKQVNEYYRSWVNADVCDNGSLDMTHLSKDA